MKLSCDRDGLNAALQAISPAVSPRPAFPILGDVLFEASENSLCLTADNQVLRLRKCLPAQVDRQGRVAVPAKLVTDFAAALDEKTVFIELESDSRILRLQCGRLKSRIAAARPEDFPTRGPAGETYMAEFDREPLLEATHQAGIAASKDASVPILTGVLFRAVGSRMRLTASDRYRLSERIIQTKSNRGEKPATMIVPEKALAALPRLFRGEQGTVLVFIPRTPGVARFTCGAAELQTGVLAGTFPDYSHMIPSGLPTTVTVPVTALLGKLRALSVFAQDEARQATIEAGLQGLTVKAATEELGDAVVDIDAVTSGPAATATVNAGFLIDVLDVIGALSANILIGPAPAPVMVRPAGDNQFTYLMMRIQQLGGASTGQDKPAL